MGVLESDTVSDLFGKYDIETPGFPEDDEKVVEQSVDDLADYMRGRQQTTAAAKDKVMHALERVRSPERPGPTVLEHDEEIGIPGTPVRRGKLAVEPNRKYRPAKVRGYRGDPAFFERNYRTEPVIFDAINTNTEVLVSGTWEVQPPRRVRRSQQSAVEEWTERARLKVMNLGCGGFGWQNFVEHAARWTQKHGFATFEPVWATDARGDFLNRLEPREVSTVDKWVLDDRQSRLQAAAFDPGRAGDKYMLTHEGPTLGDYKLLVANVGAEGHNFEGVSPQRPSIFCAKLKKLLLQIVGVGVEGFGVPIKTIEEDPDALEMIHDGIRELDDGKRKQFFDVIKRVRAVDKNTFTVPFGLLLRIHSVDGSFPQLVLDILEYLDLMMAMPFSNEGSFLGLQSSVGSYALGEVKDRQDLHSAFYYARNIARPINRLLKVWAQHDLGELEEYPRLRFRLDGLSDGSQWLSDVTQVMGGISAPQWPEKVREAAEDKLDLERGAFDVEDESGDVDDQIIYKLTNALNNGAATLTPDMVRYVHDLLGAPEPSDEDIRRHVERYEQRTLGGGPTTPPLRGGGDEEGGATAPDEEGAARLGDIAQALHASATAIAHGHGRAHDHKADADELTHDVSEGYLEHRFHEERAESALDGTEAEIGKRFRRVARELRDAWREEFSREIETNDIDPDDVQRIASEWRDEWMPRFREEAEAVLEDLARESIEAQVDEIADVDSIEAQLSDDTRQHIRLEADSIAREAYNRQTGALIDRMAEFDRGESGASLDALEESTFSREMGGRVASSVYNRGRTQVQTTIAEEAEFRDLDGRAIAERISVLDSNTCGECEKYDGARVVVGSDQYYDVQPPNKCLGGGRCRCIYTIHLPDQQGFEDLAEEVADAGGLALR